MVGSIYQRHGIGIFSDTANLKLIKTKRSIAHASKVCIHTENQVSFYLVVLHRIEVILGHLLYHVTVVPPKANSQPDSFFSSDLPAERATKS